MSASQLASCSLNLCDAPHSMDQTDSPLYSRVPRVLSSANSSRVVHEVYSGIASCQVPPQGLSTNGSPFTGAANARIGTTWTRSVSPPASLDARNWSQPCPQSDVRSESREQVAQLSVGSNSRFVVQAELRKPPANPYKSRRRCIDFGLGRTSAVSQISSPLRDDLSLVSPALVADAGHDSDTSSLFDDIEVVFPQPPQISTPLRRVHSSPFLLAKGVVRKDWDRKLPDYSSDEHRSVLHNATSGHWASMGRPDRLSEELELEMEGEALLSSKTPVMSTMRSHPLAARTFESYEYGRRMNHTSMALSSSDSQKSVGFSSPSPTNERRNATLCDARYTLTAINLEASGLTGQRKKLSHARSTCSLLPNLPIITQKENKMNFGPTHKTLPKARSVLPVASSHPPDYLYSRFREPKAYPELFDCHGIRGRQVDAKHFPPRLSLAPLACTGQRRTTQQDLSDPFVSLGSLNGSLAPARSLGTAFCHRPTRSQPITHATMMSDPSHVPKSFIDIAPEQDMRDYTSRPRKELMRKLLVRVSRGVLGWGKTLTQRTKHM